MYWRASDTSALLVTPPNAESHATAPARGSRGIPAAMMTATAKRLARHGGRAVAAGAWVALSE